MAQPHDELLHLARCQSGVISRAQLSAIGLTRGAIQARSDTLRLVRVHHGVYALGHDSLTASGRCWAAVLATKPQGYLGASAAAFAWGLRSYLPAMIDVVVTTPGGRRRRRGIRTIRAPAMQPDEVTLHPDWRIPITTPARTLFDLALRVSHADLTHAFSQASVGDLLVLDALESLLERRHDAGPVMRPLIDRHRRAGTSVLRSTLEALMLDLCRRSGLPEPEVNRRRDQREIDFFWPQANLVVEVDSWRWHRGRDRFVSDRARNRRHTLLGRRVVSYTDQDLAFNPERVAAELRQLLATVTSQ